MVIWWAFQMWRKEEVEWGNGWWMDWAAPSLALHKNFNTKKQNLSSTKSLLDAWCSGKICKLWWLNNFADWKSSTNAHKEQPQNQLNYVYTSHKNLNQIKKWALPSINRLFKKHVTSVKLWPNAKTLTPS